ncbi:hypothetical protein SynBIOSE41_02251 [Synechococcus sp. BIOS-E4-1]|nr:hypothetical protein SynBIOSE41_02251 [Synechococcus sp. BIOS-E4-1]
MTKQPSLQALPPEAIPKEAERSTKHVYKTTVQHATLNGTRGTKSIDWKAERFISTL